MKQKFDNKSHEKFIKYFWIKEIESKVEKKFYKKIYKYIKFIKWIPWLKMIAIWNSISMNNANKESDIDLYIVTTKNTMWINRIIITFIFQIFLVRKTETKHAWMFCLSFFSTTDWMDFSNWKIENDIYLYFWIVYLKPILNYNNTYENFIDINSKWADFNEYNNYFEKNKEYIKYEKNTNDFNYLKIFDDLLKKIFLTKTLNNFEKIWKPYGVIINDDLLKFHNNDIRRKIKKDLVN